jgi:hypothetical protein
MGGEALARTYFLGFDCWSASNASWFFAGGLRRFSSKKADSNAAVFVQLPGANA